MIFNRDVVTHINSNKNLRFRVTDNLEDYINKHIEMGYTHEVYNNRHILSNENEIVIVDDKNIKILNSSMDVYGGCCVGYTGLFQETNFKSVRLKNTDTSDMRFIAYMFMGSQIGDIDFTGFDTTKVRDTEGMFSKCSVKEIDLTGLNFENIESTDFMFQGCEAESIKFPKCTLDKLRSAQYMFSKCTADTIEIDLSIFDNISENNHITDNFDGKFIN